MDQAHSTILEHKKGNHLTFKDRVVIETRLKDMYSPNKIAKEIGCASSTLKDISKLTTGRLTPVTAVQ